MFRHIVFICALVLFAFCGGHTADAAKPRPQAATEAVVATPSAAATASTDEHHAEHHDDASHDDSSMGLPQTDISKFPGQIFWLVITFILTYVLMKHMALPAVESVLSVREKRISTDLGGAKAKNEAAKRLMQQYKSRLAKAHADAQAATRIVMEENAKKTAQQLEAQTAKANADIKAAGARILEQKEKAIAGLDSEVVGVIASLITSVANIAPTTTDIELVLKKVRGA